jgi:tetratricopeptide (TPR) repeat protein
MGNIESASNNFDEAMEYFKRAIAIRVDDVNNKDDTAAILLAVSYLCVSRVHFLKEDYETSLNMCAQSEALFFRTSGANAQFMAQFVLLIFTFNFKLISPSVCITRMGISSLRRRAGKRQNVPTTQA